MIIIRIRPLLVNDNDLHLCELIEPIQVKVHSACGKSTYLNFKFRLNGQYRLTASIDNGKEMQKKILVSVITAIAMGTAQSVLANNSLEDLVITAKSNSSTKDIAASVTVITAEEIAQSGASNLQEVLKNVPGFSYTTNGSSTYGRQNIGLRGMDSERVLILVDGERINATDGFIGHSNFQSSWLDVGSIERVEIIKGMGAVLYGSEAMAGVVNIITQNAKKENFARYSLSTSMLPNRDGGNHDRLSLSSGLKVSEKLFLNANVALSQRDVVTESGTLKFESQEQKSADLRMAYSINPKTELVLNISKSHEDRDKVDEAYYDIDRQRKGVALHTELDGWQTVLKAYRVNSDNAYHGFGQSPYYIHEIENNVVSAEMMGTVLDKHFVTWGLERHTTDYTKDYSSPSKTDYQAQGTAQNSLFIQDKFKLGLGTMTAGVRVDNNDQFGSETSPELGYVLPIQDNIDFKIQYSEAFKAPNIKEADDNYIYSHGYPGATVFQGNSNLKPETSQSIEVGISGLTGMTSWSAAAYRIEANNLIQSADTGTTSGMTGGPLYQYENVDQASVNGAEFTVSTDLSDSLFLDASLNLMNTDDGNGGQLSFRPNKTVKARLTYEMPRGFTANWSTNYTGESKDGNKDVAPYTIHDLAINKKINKSFNMQLAINNVSDEQNDKASDNHMTELPGREIKLSVNGAF